MLKEMAYPGSFDHEYFNSLTSAKKRMDYCRQRLEFIGVGSSRAVYKVDENIALKVAKTTLTRGGRPGKGVAQNMVEAEPWMDNYDIFAKVISHHPKYYWIEMELAKKAKRSDFDRILGIRHAFDEVVVPYLELVRERYDGTARRFGSAVSKEQKQMIETMEERDDFYDSPLWDLQLYLCDTQETFINDYKRLSSWGVVQRDGEERLVIIDYGANRQIIDTYYSGRKV